MLGRPNLQARLRADDDARFHGGARTVTLGCIWHATDSARWYGPGGTREYLNSGEKKAGYNYVILSDGAIVRFTPRDTIAYHAGVRCTWEPPGAGLIVNESVNGRTLGIAFVIPNRRGTAITAAALESALWLGSVMQDRYGYAAGMNLMHREVAPTWKSDVLPEILSAEHWRSLLASSSWPSSITPFPLATAGV
jgi:N-acetyl-anhydromuramyl-L-alanine amidase AmpD